MKRIKFFTEKLYLQVLSAPSAQFKKFLDMVFTFQFGYGGMYKPRGQNFGQF